MATRPNIVWFVADQMRADSMAHLGNPAARTPVLDDLAREGVSFSNAYCQNPVCVPSRCSFLTGLYPHTLGHRTMHYLMEEGEPDLLQSMKQEGYEVVWIGRNDFVPAPRVKEPYCDRYFDGERFMDVSAPGERVRFSHGSLPEHTVPDCMQDADLTYSFYVGGFPEHSLDHDYDWNNVNAALEYLDERAARDDERPFFLYVTLMYPHPPYMCEEPWFSLIDRDALPPRRPNVETLAGKPRILTGIRERQGMLGWTEEQFSEMRACYLGMVARFDHQLGLVLEKLRECGLYDDTSVFCFSDHGDLTGDYGIAEKCQNAFEDPLTNVPLVIKPAAHLAVRSGVRDELVELVDLPATVADMAGFELPYDQFGVSLVDTIAGGPAPKEVVFSEGGRVRGERQAMEPEHGPESPYWPRISLQHEEGPAHTKAVMARSGTLKYVLRLYEDDQLYDLERDPMELTNVVDDPAYAADARRLREAILTFFLETGDRVPRGFGVR